MEETAVLARFAAELAVADIPDDVMRMSARNLADYIGVTVGAWDEPAVQIAIQVAEALGGNPDASLLGGGRSSLVQAATINGIASHVLDFDDTHDPTILHGTGSVISAALAAGEYRSGRVVDLVAAHAIGFEVSARVALAVHPDHYDQGFHVTGTAGTFGATAAAGRLFGLNQEQMTNALSTAAAQAAGLREMFGSMTKSLHAGKAAGNGVYSALLAERGWISSHEGIEGRRGYWAVLSPRVDADHATKSLGQTWELRQDGLKPYACGVVSHPTIDAMRNLRQSTGLSPESVREVVARVNPYVVELMGKTEPRVGLEGKFSIYHCAAIAFVDGAARTRQFSDEAVLRPEVVELRRKVRAEVDPALPTSAAEVRLVANDGREWTEVVEAASGTPNNPMTDEDLVEKLLDLTEGRIESGRARSLVDRILSRDRDLTVRELIAEVAGVQA